MPLVPTVDQPSVEIAPSATPFQSVRGVTPEAFGSGIGRATESLGGSLEEASRIAAKKEAEDDERDAKRKFLDYGSSLQKTRTDFLSTEGTNTLDSYDQALEDADALGKEQVEAASGNKRVSESLRLAIQAERLQFQKQADNHLSGQKKVVDDNQYDAFLAEFTDNGIEGYKSFGSTEGVPEDGTAVDAARSDAVLRNELAIRDLARDKARKDGEDERVKEAEAVAGYYDSVVRAAVADGNASTALRIFNASRDKIPGSKGVALKNFLKDQTTEDTALFMARKIYADVSHLPIEQRLGAGAKELLKIDDSAKFKFTKLHFDSLLKTDAQIKALETPALVREKVMGLLNSGMSAAQVALELNKTKDPVTRAAELGFLSSVEKINDGAKKEIAEDFAGEVYREEGDDVAKAERQIKDKFKDDPESQGVALAHLKSIADVDESLLETDLPARADRSKKDIISKVRNDLPSGASNAEQKALAILRAENIKDPGEKQLVISGINSFYNSLQGFDKEQAEDAGVALVDAVANTNKTLAGQVEAIARSDANSITKARATALISNIDAAAKKDEKAAKDAAASVMSAAMASGQSPSEFRASSPENAAVYDIVATDGPLMSGMVSSFRLAAEGLEFPFVSHRSATEDLRTMTDDELVDLDLLRYQGRLNRADTNTLASRKRGAIAKRKTENARVAGTVTRLVNRFQPYNAKGKPKLTKGVLAKVENYVWTQIDDAQEAGKKLEEEDVRRMVISAYTVVEFTPDDPRIFSFEFFGADRGGDNTDVAGALIAEMSDDELNSLRVDEDNFPEEMSRFLQLAVDGWKAKNPDLGEPSEEDLELLRGNVVKFALKSGGNR